jgi:rhodanese-related sulfurtransferase
MQHLTAPELASRIADASRPAPVLLDVREPWEVEKCSLPDSVAIAMNTIPARMQELDPEAEIICICHHGARSMQVAAFLERQGFENVTNLTGGIHAWALQVDPAMATY